MPTRVRSYCKINLGLAIGPPRPDRYHHLATLYQTLALHDYVTVEVRNVAGAKAPLLSQAVNAGTEVPAYQVPADTTSRSSAASAGQPLSGSLTGAPGQSSITLTTNHPDVPTDSRNTAWKMVEQALERMGVAAEVAIHIEKNLPVQGGMGAGSANAAAALIGLERELGTALPDDERLNIAAEVGSDVPLFLIGGAVLGQGRGEVVSPMMDLPRTPCVVAVPQIGVSTPHAFQEWDALCASPGHVNPLTGHPQTDRLERLSHVYVSVLMTERASESSGIVRNDLAGNPLLALVRTGIENDFEQVVFPQYPPLREIKRLLAGDPDNGALYAALSGSGSALFGLYGNEEDARAAQQRVQASGCRAILTETLPRTEYWNGMFVE